MMRAAVLLAAALLGLAAPPLALAHQVSRPNRLVESVDTVAAPGLPNPSAAVTTGREPSAAMPPLEEWRGPSAPATKIPAPLLWLGLALSVLAIAGGRRRTIAATVALALAVLAFETGLHSVHHLGDARGVEQCSVASVSTHLGGTPAEAPSVVIVTANASQPSQPADPIAPRSQPFRPDAGRAPPPQPLVV
jgi:hypothetical protein